jgi:hypothetical protein
MVILENIGHDDPYILAQQSLLIVLSQFSDILTAVGNQAHLALNRTDLHNN